MLDDLWGHSIKDLMLPSVRFQIEQAVSNISYLYHLSELLNKLGYCAIDKPKKVGKVEGKKYKDKLTNPPLPFFFLPSRPSPPLPLVKKKGRGGAGRGLGVRGRGLRER